MFDLRDYVSPRNTSLYKGIPVAHRDEVRKLLKASGMTGSQIRFEYRGKREYKVVTLRSGKTFKKYDPSCRLRNATHFAVYERD
jgi:hypothetical protein